MTTRDRAIKRPIRRWTNTGNIDTSALLYVSENPGCTAREMKRYPFRYATRMDEVYEVLENLISVGMLRVQETGKRQELFATDKGKALLSLLSTVCTQEAGQQRSQVSPLHPE